MDELTAWLVLARAPGLHAGTLGPLLARFESVHALVTATPAALREAAAEPALIRSLQHGAADTEADLRWLDHEHHHLVWWGSPLYPTLSRCSCTAIRNC
jgi:DNA processing protein